VARNGQYFLKFAPGSKTILMPRISGAGRQVS